jgi:hypothetical protein
MRLVRVAFSSVLALVVAGGCFERHFYNVAIYNTTPYPIEEATVTFEGFRSVGGFIDPGRYKIHGGVTKRLPDSVTVQWVTPHDARRHQVVVRTRPAVPEGYSDTIFFDIRADGTVTVVPRTEYPRSVQ